MKKMSVKLRVTLWYVLVMVIISTVVMVAMTSIGKEMVNRDITNRVVKVVSDMSMQVVDRRGNIRPVPAFRFYQNGVHLALYDDEFNLLSSQSPFAIEETLVFKNNEPRKEVHGKNEYIVFDREIRTPFSTEVLWLKGMISVKDESYAIATVMKNNILLTVMLIIIAALGGYFIISRAFVPVNKIRKTADEIAESNDLSQRINLGNGGDEISALANTFDNMLDKIEKAFEKEKQFTSDASHELRTPVSVILSECEYANECAKTVEEYSESVTAIKRQADRMSKLISELLTISRMDRDTLKTNFESTDISELVSFVCDDEEKMHSDNVKLIRNIQPDIMADCDKFLLARLVINLISNACQYSKESGSIEVSLLSDKENVTLSVKDDGIGISKEDTEKIWERFYRVDESRTANDSDSMGLGLSMVKWIANAHNGKVNVESEPGKGSKFTFIFPICRT